MPLLDLKYFDEIQQTWTVRRPQVSAHGGKKFSLLTIVLGSKGDERDRMAAAIELVTVQTPTFVALREVMHSQYELLAMNAVVRRSYALTDNAKHECSLMIGEKSAVMEHGCCFLVKLGIHVDFVESIPKFDKQSRPMVVLHIRQFQQCSCTFASAHLDPDTSAAAREQVVTGILSKLESTDLILLTANFHELVIGTEDPNFRRSLAAVRTSLGWADASEVCGTLPSPSHGVWIRQSPKVHPSITQFLGEGDPVLQHASMVTFITGSSPQQQPNAGILIPQPRSTAKGSKNSPSVAPTPMFVDPAILAADDKPSPASLPASSLVEEGINVANFFPHIPRKKWRAEKCYTLKGHCRSLSAQEALYDQSYRFTKIADAIEALNSGSFHWSHDYIIINSNILSSDTVSRCDYKAFVRYAANHTPPERVVVTRMNKPIAPPPDVGSNISEDSVLLIGQPAVLLPLPPSTTTTTATTTATSAKPTAAQFRPTHHRQRQWSEANATMVYQITPKEMRFDISPVVGASKTNLASAVARLNAKKSTSPADVSKDKQDALYNYQFDYALLYSAERQGYWLLSALDVPCDIVSCREVVT